ncbi:hypothetical protein V7111_01580, partial [Neobacillus niacini]|uniref:hypothetical protein n=1 Tax=Neobacillus niacini TaxID=86668 RepID=UPI002FFD5A2E
NAVLLIESGLFIGGCLWNGRQIGFGIRVGSIQEINGLALEEALLSHQNMNQQLYQFPQILNMPFI